MNHNGVDFNISEGSGYASWSVIKKDGSQVGRQESDKAAAIRKAKKYIDQHRSDFRR
jgi:hypothetical protein